MNHLINHHLLISSKIHHNIILCLNKVLKVSLLLKMAILIMIIHLMIILRIVYLLWYLLIYFLIVPSFFINKKFIFVLVNTERHIFEIALFLSVCYFFYMKSAISTIHLMKIAFSFAAVKTLFSLRSRYLSL
jgi:hypothetical protein